MKRRTPFSSLRRARDESGQVFALFAVALVVLLGMTALVIDLGYAYYVKRSLQASADAAATAGALELPDAGAAVSRAQQYGGSKGGKNERGNIPSVTTAVSTKCLAIAPCKPVNAVVVRQTTKVRTLFARVLGIDTLNVQARATACSPCGAGSLDVMLVLDRSSSMCEDDPVCTDLNNARQGIRAFLRVMDPAYTSVGLAVFPPAADSGAACMPAERSNYDLPAAPYVLVPLSSDYLVNGDLNPLSPLVSTVGCLKKGYGTAYATAIDRAQAELKAHGNPEADDVIVMLTDGGANTGPNFEPLPYQEQPCRRGVDSAVTAKKLAGTTIYTIGYDLYADGGAANFCRRRSDGAPEEPAMTADQALREIATGPEYFYNQPSAGELETIFTKIAVHLTGTRLVDDDG